MRCEFCGYEMRPNDMFCQNCGQKRSAAPVAAAKPKKKKPLYKKWWFWVIVGVLFLGLVGSCDSEQPQDENIAIETVEPTSEPEPTPAPTPEITETEYKAMCKEYRYKDVLRDPASYVGEKIKITVQLQQKLEGGFIDTYTYFRAYDDESGMEWYFDNEYIIFDDRYDQSEKLLEEDIILVYGEIKEPEEITRALTNTEEEVFSISMKYAELIEG